MGRNSRKLKKLPVPLGVGIRQHPANLYFIGGCAIFLVAFSILLLGIIASNVYTNWDSRHWVATDATVIQSQVKIHSDSEKGSSYSLSISFNYRFAGQTYVSDRYGLKGTSSHRYATIERLADQLPPGKPITCYVNPRQPSVAVIDRSETDDWIGPLMGLALCLPATFWSARETIRLRKIIRHQWPGRSDKPLPKPKNQPVPEGIILAPPDVYLPRIDKAPLTLISHWDFQSLHSRLILMLSIMCFFVPLILRLATDWLTWLEYPIRAYIVLAAVGLIFIMPMLLHYQILSMRTRITIRLPRGAIQPGKPLQLAWNIPKRADQIPHLWIKLQGQEQIGSGESINRPVFREITLIDTTVPAEIQSGDVTVPLPADLMHSLQMRLSAIRWYIVAGSEGPRFRRVNEALPVVVLPAKWPVENG